MMKTECIQNEQGFRDIDRKRVIARFNGDTITMRCGMIFRSGSCANGRERMTGRGMNLAKAEYHFPEKRHVARNETEKE
jgi:hypothetical protein